MQELVVLVDEHNNQIGTASKKTVHTHSTPLHRGFSLFVFTDDNQLLVTKRSNKKKTFPGVWTNTVCGHPGPEESVEDAAIRRAKEELGLRIRSTIFISEYRYRFADIRGIVENEICPILIAYTNETPDPIKTEVEAWKWVQWEDVRRDMIIHPHIYSPWSREEAQIIEQFFRKKEQK